MILLIDTLAIVFLIIGWWVALGAYPRLPEKIPIHFGISGEPDGWGARWMIFLMPVIATLIVAMNWFIFFTRLKGSPQMPAAMELPLHLLVFEMTALFTYITWRMTEVAFERAKGLGVWFLPITLLGIMGTGAWMIVAGKIN